MDCLRHSLKGRSGSSIARLNIKLQQSTGAVFHMVSGFEISNWMHLSVGQVDCKNHLSECTIHLSEIYKANATYVKIRNTHSSVGQVLQVFHLSDCHFYLSQMIGRVKFRTLGLICTLHGSVFATPLIHALRQHLRNVLHLARCHGTIWQCNWRWKGVTKKSTGSFTLGMIWCDIAGGHNDMPPEMAAAPI